MKMTENVSDGLSYSGSVLIKVAYTADTTVCHLSVGLFPYSIGFCNIIFSIELQGYS